MAKFNLKKTAQYSNINLNLDAENKTMDIKDVTHGNINLSMPIKDKDNTLPLDVQMNDKRKKDDTTIPVESRLNSSSDKEIYNNCRQEIKDKTISPINMLSAQFDKQHSDAFAKAEKDTIEKDAFWDKYMQKPAEGNTQKVDNNVQNTNLANSPDRFKNISDPDADKAYKDTATKLAEVDAGIFHVYAKAYSENRNVDIKDKYILKKLNEIKMHHMKKSALNWNVVNNNQAFNVDNNSNAPMTTPESPGSEVIFRGDENRAEVVEIQKDKIGNVIKEDVRAVYEEPGKNNMNEARQDYL